MTEAEIDEAVEDAIILIKEELGKVSLQDAYQITVRLAGAVGGLAMSLWRDMVMDKDRR